MIDQRLLKDAKTIAMVYNVFAHDSARIAGGCLRDLYCGKPVKDVDILVEWESQADYRELEIMADRLGYTWRNYQEEYGCHEDGQLRSVYTLTKDGHLPIDIIFLNCSVQERIEQFPVNASMIWLEGDRLVTHEKFDSFYASGELEFTDTAPEEYIRRISDKYKD